METIRGSFLGQVQQTIKMRPLQGVKVRFNESDWPPVEKQKQCHVHSVRGPHTSKRHAFLLLLLLFSSQTCFIAYSGALWDKMVIIQWSRTKNIHVLFVCLFNDRYVYITHGGNLCYCGILEKIVEVVLGYCQILECPQNGYSCLLTRAMTQSPHNRVWWHHTSDVIENNFLYHLLDSVYVELQQTQNGRPYYGHHHSATITAVVIHGVARKQWGWRF